MQPAVRALITSTPFAASFRGAAQSSGSLTPIVLATRRFQNCYDSKCCTSEPAFGCLKRNGRAFAQCRRIADGKCESDAMWECPGWEDCTTGR